MASDVIEFDPFDPKKIYEALIKRCKAVKRYEIRCIIDESWIGIAPFDMIIEDGIFICYPIAPTRRDAFLEVANKLPVIKFLTRQDD
jgi:hypothetical protein